MSKVKILITLEGGIIQGIASSQELDIIINDYDNEEEDQIIHTEEDDRFEDGEAHKLITASEFPLSMAEQNIKEYLKDVKF